MNGDVLDKVWAYSHHKGEELNTMLAVARNANADGLAWPELNTLAKRLRVKDGRTVNERLKAVADEVVVFRGGLGPGSTHVYLVTCGLDATQIQVAASLAKELATMPAREREDYYNTAKDAEIRTNNAPLDVAPLPMAKGAASGATDAPLHNAPKSKGAISRAKGAISRAKGAFSDAKGAFSGAKGAILTPGDAVEVLEDIEELEEDAPSKPSAVSNEVAGIAEALAELTESDIALPYHRKQITKEAQSYAAAGYTAEHVKACKKEWRDRMGKPDAPSIFQMRDVMPRARRKAEKDSDDLGKFTRVEVNPNIRYRQFSPDGSEYEFWTDSNGLFHQVTSGGTEYRRMLDGTWNRREPDGTWVEYQTA